MSFCGLYCTTIIVFLVCGSTWRCEHTLFCVEIGATYKFSFIHSIQINGTEHFTSLQFLFLLVISVSVRKLVHICKLQSVMRSILISSISLYKVLSTVMMMDAGLHVCMINQRQEKNKSFNSLLGEIKHNQFIACLLYTSPSPRDLGQSRMPSSA